MRLPTWEELESVDEQLDVLEWPLDETIFVAGPPGSGKTVLAVRRAQMVAEGQGDCIWESLVGYVAKQPPAGADFTSKTTEMGLTRRF